MEEESYYTMDVAHKSICKRLLDFVNHQPEGEGRVARLHANNAIKRDGDFSCVNVSRDQSSLVPRLSLLPCNNSKYNV